jgi:hypothetical protein
MVVPFWLSLVSLQPEMPVTFASKRGLAQDLGVGIDDKAPVAGVVDDTSARPLFIFTEFDARITCSDNTDPAPFLPDFVLTVSTGQFVAVAVCFRQGAPMGQQIHRSPMSLEHSKSPTYEIVLGM